ncbi:MAG: DUF2608 domain-containing protein [Pseudobdellovibrionaceae bacterium]
MKKLLFFMALSLNLHASELNHSDDIWTAVNRAETLAKKYGAPHVLFASDLDNTLLKTNQDLASEPWFNWQFELLGKPMTDERIACDMPDLLHFFHVTISLSRVSPVQEDQAKAIQQMQKAGINTMAITARGDAVASATFAQLQANQIDFSKHNLAGDGYGAPHIPWNIENPEASGLTAKDVKRWNLKSAMPVLYQRGVLFSDGQNKAALLRTLIHKTKRDIKAVVFWDNDEKNVHRVFDGFNAVNVEVAAIRASHQDTDIQRFNESNKTKVTDDYLALRKVLDGAYAYPRPCELPIDKKLKN